MSRELEWIEEENSRLLEQETETIKTSKFRWIVLALFCFQSVANSLVCFAFAAVAAQTQEALQTSQTTVDAFVWGFLIAYLPGTVLSQLVFLKKGFSYCFNAGSLLNLGGCGIRAFAVILIKTQTQKWSWILILIGQILAGIAQPFFFNAPAKISGNWFATSERDLATTLAAMTSPIGNALSQIIPVAMIAGGVSGTEAVNFILLSQAGISLAATILSYFLFRAQPEIPPSVSAQERRVREAEEKNITRELTWMSTFSIAKEHVEHLLCDRVRKEKSIYTQDFIIFSVGFFFFCEIAFWFSLGRLWIWSSFIQCVS